jgi:hypothetical protein
MWIRKTLDPGTTAAVEPLFPQKMGRILYSFAVDARDNSGDASRSLISDPY